MGVVMGGDAVPVPELPVAVAEAGIAVILLGSAPAGSGCLLLDAVVDVDIGGACAAGAAPELLSHAIPNDANVMRQTRTLHWVRRDMARQHCSRTSRSMCKRVNLTAFVSDKDASHRIR